MDALVCPGLELVLQPPQEAIGRCQFARHRGRELAGLAQRCQRLQQPAAAQRGRAPAADQLERLHDELDLADAAAAVFDVAGQPLACDLAFEPGLEVAQRLERAEVEVAPEDKRAQ